MAEADAIPKGLGVDLKKGLFSSSYVCQWGSWEENRPGIVDMSKWKITAQDETNIPKDEELNALLPIRDIDQEVLKSPDADKIQVTWIGHATVLVQYDGATILSDPVFLDYCGPNSYMGYKRYRKAACKIEDFRDTRIDAIIISHNHYDHLEADAVQKLSRQHPLAKWFVAENQKDWMVKKGVKKENVVELSWWQGEKVNIEEKEFEFICTPSQHWCGRAPPLDMNKILWCSWVVKGPTKSYYFAGDTGYYDKLFQEIGKRYGPFDLAALPIGAYNPRYITKYQHANPKDAVKIHKDINSKQSIAMHWGTFALTNEFYLEPPRELAKALKKRKCSQKEFVSLCHGETWCVGKEREHAPFMIGYIPDENNQ